MSVVGGVAACTLATLSVSRPCAAIARRVALCMMVRGEIMMCHRTDRRPAAQLITFTLERAVSVEAVLLLAAFTRFSVTLINICEY